ncbi:carboxypeptidase-like regulatory domain-containing protein [Streptomyces caniscabiei]|uniref:carboxypeptidase-like regulatory domain-containing protein n=1 Tax=Streptomyces caniscabiei TaxID=2746961 RepID=UPI0029B08564|nr:carboxypeptidase-like regulatory domain-containing protein [Streptomyces caniscabiei]MDX2776423.1 carboxypeptidase-like regulatory domain-containing protein [Streptomyces caniscabiei]
MAERMAEDKDKPDVDKEIEKMEKSESQDASAQPTPELQLPKENKFKRFLKTRKGKVITILLAVVVIIGVLLAIPVSRYGILGNFIKKDVTVTVTDATTKKPVSQATIMVAGLEAKTDGDGKAVIGAVPVGEYTMKVSKNYYKESEGAYVVPVLSAPGQPEVLLTATGRQVTVLITNKITNAPLEDATITVNDTAASTNANGQATLVLPADKETLQGKAEKNGYNALDVTVQVTDQASANKFSLTPNGSVVYLSKASGTIDVMKANLDGSDAKVLVEGTGNESDTATSLIASPDWKYAVLTSSRDDANQRGKLYLVNVQTGVLTLIDEGDVDFQPTGWIDDTFVYMVARPQAPWLPKGVILKSFSAKTHKLTILDESRSSGSDGYTMQDESIAGPILMNGLVVYGKSWAMGSAVMQPTDKKAALMSIYPDGSARKVIRDFAVNTNTFLELRRQSPKKFYLRVGSDGKQVYYEYAGGSLKEVAISEENFYRAYSRYIASPSGQKQFWTEVRNGKNTLVVGDSEGNNPSVVAEQSDLSAFGWYGDDYILMTKDDRELYIAGVSDATNPVKIADYHKPSIQYPVYRFSYGRLYYY